MSTGWLPIEIWLAVVDHVLADTDHPGRWRDLARLAWTCRDAYMAAQRPLWQHLRLVFRHFQEQFRQISKYPDASQVDEHLQKHHQVMNASMFPSSGQSSVKSERLKRILAVSKDYPHLRPFVVLKGILYMASLVEHERNPSDPDFSGIASLWGEESLARAGRAVGGLVLVPYPLQWVQELTIDALAFAGNNGWHTPTRFNELFNIHALPFLLTMGPEQIRSFHISTTSPDCSVCVSYGRISERYTGIVHTDNFLDKVTHLSPVFTPASTRHVRILQSERSVDDESVLNEIARLPQLNSLEFLGTGCLDLRPHRDVCRLFSSSTLTRLILEFDFAKAVKRHPTYTVHLPRLTELSLSIQVALTLFSTSKVKSMFPPIHSEPQSSPVAFPSLTHLKLVGLADLDDDPFGDCQPFVIPRLPYHHMPCLAHFCIHLHVNACPRSQKAQRIRSTCLQSLVAFTRLESFAGLGLTGVERASPEKALAVASPPFFARHMEYVQVAPEFLLELKLWIKLPRNVSEWWG